MVGFVAAVVAELSTNQSVWSQIAGKTASNGRLLEHGWQFAPLGFGAVVTLLTYASIAPQFQAGEPALHRRKKLHTCSIARCWGVLAALQSVMPAQRGLHFCWQAGLRSQATVVAITFAGCSGTVVTLLTCANITPYSCRQAKHGAC